MRTPRRSHSSRRKATRSSSSILQSRSRRKALALKWAEEQAKDNPWFAKVLKSQLEYEKLWENASSYRNVKYQ